MTASQRGCVIRATNCFQRGCGSSAARSIVTWARAGRSLVRRLSSRDAAGSAFPGSLTSGLSLDGLELHRARERARRDPRTPCEVALGAVELALRHGEVGVRVSRGSPASTRAGDGRRGAERGRAAAAGRRRAPKPPRPATSPLRTEAGRAHRAPPPTARRGAVSSPIARSSTPTNSASGAPFTWARSRRRSSARSRSRPGPLDLLCERLRVRFRVGRRT